jgi:DNA-binding transcriptional ArsR family regulator
MSQIAPASPDICEEHLVHADKVQQAAENMPDEQVFDDLADLFKMLSHPTRLKLVHALDQEELCVCDLAALLGMTESAISHQLRLLRNLRLVKHRREGKLVYYTLDDQHVRQLFEAALEHQQE